MNRKIFFIYHNLVLEGILDGMYCVDEDHPLPLHPFIDLETEDAYFECLACTYRVTPGLAMYDKIVAEVSATQENPPEEDIEPEAD